MKLILFGVIMMIFGTMVYLKSDIRHKKYIYNNIENIKYDGEYESYFIDEEHKYFTDITIKIRNDHSYYVIFWGNRNTFLWNIFSDKTISVDVNYNRYKGENTIKDEELLLTLKNLNNV